MNKLEAGKRNRGNISVSKRRFKLDVEKSVSLRVSSNSSSEEERDEERMFSWEALCHVNASHDKFFILSSSGAPLPNLNYFMNSSDPNG